MDEEKNSKENIPINNSSEEEIQEQAVPPVENNFEKQLAACMDEKEAYLNSWKRAKADMLNYLKDETERIKNSEDNCRASLIKDILPILDSLDLAARATQKKEENDIGINMIRAQLEETLKRKGLKKVEVNEGDAFDPNFHEAIGEIESEHPIGTIAKEFEKGYVIEGKIIRPARVMLSGGNINEQNEIKEEK